MRESVAKYFKDTWNYVDLTFFIAYMAYFVIKM